MAKILKSCLLVFFILSFAACKGKDSAEELAANLTHVLDSININFPSFANYFVYSYDVGTHEDVYYVSFFSLTDSIHRYAQCPILINITTGKVIDIYIAETEEAKVGVINRDIEAIEGMCQQVFALRDAIGSEHLWYFRGAYKTLAGDSRYDFQVAFKYKRHYYVLSHAPREIPDTTIRVIENWYLIRSEDSPLHR